MSSHDIVCTGNLEVGSGQDPSCDRHEAKDSSKDPICLEGEAEECKQSKAPDEEVKANHGVEVSACGTLYSVVGGRVCSCQSESRELQETKGQPEDGKEGGDHHGEGVAHDPLKDGGQDQKDRADKEEHATGQC